MAHRKRKGQGDNHHPDVLPWTHQAGFLFDYNASSSSSYYNGVKERRGISSIDKKVSSSLLFRTLWGCMLSCVIVLYVLATRHVMLHSSSSRSIFDSTAPEMYKKVNQARILFQPIPTHNEQPHRTTSSSSFSKKPRKIGYFYGSTNPSSFLGVDQNDLPMVDNRVIRIHRQTLMTEEERKRQMHLENSKHYRHNRADTMADMGKNCVAQYKWQESMYPTCNHFMELDITESISQQLRNEIFEDSSAEESNGPGMDIVEVSTTPRTVSTSLKFLSCGYWRDVWKLTDERDKGTSERMVLKTQRYTHDIDARNYDRHRRDAVASERLTSSPFIMDIYGYCATSGLFEFADGGSLEDAIWAPSLDVNPWSPMERLIVSYQVASALAEVHNYPKQGVPAIVHTDLATGQYVYVEEAGSFKLQDFNRARFIAWNNKTNTTCTYTVGNNPGKVRAPEEYEYEPQTEKVDVYSMGNILYSILTQLYPFEDEKFEVATQKVMAGERPSIPQVYLNSTDPFDQAMLKAIEMCWVHNPEERATAAEVQNHIVSTLKKMNVRSETSHEGEENGRNSQVQPVSSQPATL